MDGRTDACHAVAACSLLLLFSSNPWRVGSIMKEHFPRIDWYYCGQDGTLTVRASPEEAASSPSLPC